MIHASFTRLANLAQQTMGPVLFSQLLVCAVVAALNLFALQSSDFISYDTLISTYIMVIVIVVTFVYCHLSSQTTTYLLSVNDIIYDCDWFMLPMKQQKLIILPMQRSQRAFYFNGLGLVNCSSMTFLSVGFSDYLFNIWIFLCYQDEEI